MFKRRAFIDFVTILSFTVKLYDQLNAFLVNELPEKSYWPQTFQCYYIIESKKLMINIHFKWNKYLCIFDCPPIKMWAVFF